MPKFAALAPAVLLSSIVLAGLTAAAGAEYEVNAPDDPMYSNCQYRFAVIYPGGARPTIRDFSYGSGGAMAPARQFYVEDGGDRYSVTVVVFPNGPAVDDGIVEQAAAAIRQRGEVRFQFAEDYDPGMPGRQLNVFLGNGRQIRASVYMADRHLVITEAESAVGSFPALQFEQSITLLSPEGVDLDRPNAGFPRKFPCLELVDAR